MTKEELLEIIREELASVLEEMYGQGYGVSTSPEEAVCPVCHASPCKCEELDERTIARREPPRKMTQPQVKGRDSIGKKFLKNKRAVSYFKKKFGDDWKSYMWATATNRAIGGKHAGKGKRKKD